MEITSFIGGALAITATIAISALLPRILKPVKPNVRDNITSIALGLLIAYVAIYYVVIPFSRTFGANVWLH